MGHAPVPVVQRILAARAGASSHTDSAPRTGPTSLDSYSGAAEDSYSGLGAIMVASGATQSITRLVGSYSTKENKDFYIGWGHGQSEAACVSALALTLETFPTNDPRGCRSQDMVPSTIVTECNYVEDFEKNPGHIDVILSVASLTHAGATVVLFEEWYDEATIHGYIQWPAPPQCEPRVTYLGKNHVFLAELHDCFQPSICAPNWPSGFVTQAIQRSERMANGASPLSFYDTRCAKPAVVLPIPTRDGLDAPGIANLERMRPGDPLSLWERHQYNWSIAHSGPPPAVPPPPTQHHQRLMRRRLQAMREEGRDIRERQRARESEGRAYEQHRDPYSFRYPPRQSGNGNARP